MQPDLAYWVFWLYFRINVKCRYQKSMLGSGNPAIYSVTKCVKVADMFRQIIATFLHATCIPYFGPIIEWASLKLSKAMTVWTSLSLTVSKFWSSPSVSVISLILAVTLDAWSALAFFFECNLSRYTPWSTIATGLLVWAETRLGHGSVTRETSMLRRQEVNFQRCNCPRHQNYLVTSLQHHVIHDKLKFIYKDSTNNAGWNWKNKRLQQIQLAM